MVGGAPLIAVVNHDPVFLRLIERLLRNDGYQTLVCPSSNRAHEQIEEAKPDLVLLDTWLETRDAGWAILQTLWLDEDTMDIPILICSSDRAGFDERLAQLQGKPVEVLYKPFDPEALIEKVRAIVGAARRD